MISWNNLYSFIEFFTSCKAAMHYYLKICLVILSVLYNLSHYVLYTFIQFFTSCKAALHCYLKIGLVTLSFLSNLSHCALYTFIQFFTSCEAALHCYLNTFFVTLSFLVLSYNPKKGKSHHPSICLSISLFMSVGP